MLEKNWELSKDENLEKKMDDMMEQMLDYVLV